ncbi:MAG: RES family NAD+ phosphorylase [Dongiaceae bacterium]
MASRLSGPLTAYRIADRRHPILDGAGSLIVAGRWHSIGRRVIYASTSFAVALLEKLVHSNTGKVPKTHVAVEIQLPAGVAIERITGEDIPGWDRADCIASRAQGDRWFDERRSLALLVPSVVARPEENLLLNQEHPDFRLVTHGEPRPVIWDERLFVNRA